MPLIVPEGFGARWLSEPEDRAKIERWTAASREASLYSTPSYVEFACAQNGRADLLWLERDGNPVLGLPLHPVDQSRVTTGYSGMMFPDGRGDGPMRRGVAALMAFVEANAGVGVQVVQAAQSAAYDDPARMTTLAALLEGHGLRGPSVYSRILRLEAADGGDHEDPDVSNEVLLEQGLAPYEAELRNQIRQAVRHGLHATCLLPRTDTELNVAYDEFVPLHRESWQRTGMTPHAEQHWTSLARAILDGGGRDMLIFVRNDDTRPHAAVVCHIRGSRALYWAGASDEQGLRQRANPLCLHAAIQACRQLGVRRFELGRFAARERSEKEASITRYKAQFGGDLVRIIGFEIAPTGLTVAVRRALARLNRARGRRGGQ